MNHVGEQLIEAVAHGDGDGIAVDGSHDAVGAHAVQRLIRRPRRRDPERAPAAHVAAAKLRLDRVRSAVHARLDEYTERAEQYDGAERALQHDERYIRFDVGPSRPDEQSVKDEHSRMEANPLRTPPFLEGRKSFLSGG